MAEPESDRWPAEQAEGRTLRADDGFLKSLRAHGQVVESESPNAPLAPGQTHVFVRRPGDDSGVLIEKRKSYFSR
ncbi:hypothetical protein [Methylopila sp. M107]|uniref:hypothetical protein n=1 Tax=Methylopila sp. M107 TaxID=1101190 RepID=UPI0012DE026F|nr:hypothetical protein [Methylopila sp. M107]